MLEFIPSPPITTNLSDDIAGKLHSLHTEFCHMAKGLCGDGPSFSVDMLISSLQKDTLTTLQSTEAIDAVINYCKEQQKTFMLFQKCIEKYKQIHQKFITEAPGFNPINAILALDLSLKDWKNDRSYTYNVLPFTSIYHRFSLRLLLDMCSHKDTSDKHYKLLTNLFQDYIIQAYGSPTYQESQPLFAYAIAPYKDILRANIASRSNRDIAIHCRGEYEASPLSAILSREEFHIMKQNTEDKLPPEIMAISQVIPHPATVSDMTLSQARKDTYNHKRKAIKTYPPSKKKKKGADAHLQVSTTLFNKDTTQQLYTTPDDDIFWKQVIKAAGPSIFGSDKPKQNSLTSAGALDTRIVQELPTITQKFDYIFAHQRNAYESKFIQNGATFTREQLYLHLICIGKGSLTKGESKALTDHATTQREKNNPQDIPMIPGQKSRDKIALLSLDLSYQCATNTTIKAYISDFCIPFRQVGMRFS